MAISLSELVQLADLGILHKKGLNIIDIGSSNLQFVEVETAIKFIQRFNQEISYEDLYLIAKRLEEGSGYSIETGGVNRSWVGEILELCGMKYKSLDISPMYHTEIFDLNFQNVAKQDHGSADVVLNFGTTEHIFNQFNTFKVIHDLCAPNRFMVHSLPCSGYCDHGFFQYTGRFFYELAGINNYEIIHSSYSDSFYSDMLWSDKQYAEIFPALKKYVNRDKIEIPSFCHFIIYKKQYNKPFKISLETSTTVNKNYLIDYAKKVNILNSFFIYIKKMFNI